MRTEVMQVRRNSSTFCEHLIQLMDLFGRKPKFQISVREFLLQVSEIGRDLFVGLDLWSDKRKQFEDDTLPLRWGEKKTYSNKMTCQEQLSPNVAKVPTEMENKLN